jgi:hypothetical protein
VAVTTEQINRTFRIASEAQRHQAMVDSIMTPELRKMMQEQGKRISEATNFQIKTRNLFSPALEAQLKEQNQRIAEMLDTSGLRKVIANIDFKLPDGFAEQMAAYRQQLEVQAAEETEAQNDGGAGLGRLAEEREAIIICLQRIGVAMEGFSYVPGSPLPHIIGFLILALAMIGEVANEKLGEREAEAD